MAKSKARKHPKTRKNRKSRTTTSSFRKRHYWGKDKSGRRRWLLRKNKKARRRNTRANICTRCGHTQREHYTIGRSDGVRYRKLKHAFTTRKNAKAKDAKARARATKARRAYRARRGPYTPPPDTNPRWSRDSNFRGFKYEAEGNARAQRERQERARQRREQDAERERWANSQYEQARARAHRAANATPPRSAPAADCGELKREWRRKITEHHPDRYPVAQRARQEEIAKGINETYQRAKKARGC